MSLFSYISFPRQIELNGLKGKLNPSKTFTIGEIRGTDLEKQWEQQSGGSIQDLPDNLKVYFGDWSDFHGIQIFDKYEATFVNTFKNEFVYGFQADFMFRDMKKSLASSMEIYNGSNEVERGGQSESEFLDFSRKMINDMNRNAKISRQELLDIVHLYINPSECIELYSETVDSRNIFNFGPPKEEILIDSEQISTSEILDLKEYTKIVIFSML